MGKKRYRGIDISVWGKDDVRGERCIGKIRCPVVRCSSCSSGQHYPFYSRHGLNFIRESLYKQIRSTLGIKNILLSRDTDRISNKYTGVPIRTVYANRNCSWSNSVLPPILLSARTTAFFGVPLYGSPTADGRLTSKKGKGLQGFPHQGNASV